MSHSKKAKKICLFTGIALSNMLIANHTFAETPNELKVYTEIQHILHDNIRAKFTKPVPQIDIQTAEIISNMVTANLKTQAPTAAPVTETNAPDLNIEATAAAITAETSAPQTQPEEPAPATKTGYTTANVNIRTAPSLDSEILYVMSYNTSVEYIPYNEDWLQITDDGSKKYISAHYVSDTQANYANYDTPSHNSFKSYMDYRCITNKASKQWKMQLEAYTHSNGIRMINDRMCIAMGNGYHIQVGDFVDLIMENGSVIHCVIGDIKADKDTDASRRQNPNGSIAEFIVDTSVLSREVKRQGDISYVNNDLKGEIVSVKVYD